jgi:hypothetical protein
MATYNLTGQKIKNTYGQLAQVNDSNKLVDGLGNEKQIVTSSIVNFPTEVSRSAAEAGFGAGGGTATWPVSGTPSGIVSGAAQLPQIATNTADIASLTAATSSYLTSLPSGVVSSSAQVDLSLATGTAANATNATNADNIALSADSTNTNRYVSFTATANGDGTLLTDAGLLYNSFSNTLTTTTVVANVTGDLTGNADTATSATTATSASYAVTASHVPGLAGAGLVSGTGTDSIRSSDNLTTTPAIAAAEYSIAIGEQAEVTSVPDAGYSVAIGYNATATNGNSVAVGIDSSVSGLNAVSIGSSATAGQTGAVAIGQNANSQGNSVAIGAGATMGNSYGFAGGYNARANNDASIAIGGDINVSSNQAIGIGTDINIDGSSRRAVALGQNADISTSEGGITLGGQANVTGATGGIAIGWGSSTTGAYGIAIGSGSKVTTTDEININDTWTYDGSERTTIGSVLNLPATHPLPTGQLGDIATSGSALYFHNGTSWAAIS